TTSTSTTCRACTKPSNQARPAASSNDSRCTTPPSTEAGSTSPRSSCLPCRRSASTSASTASPTFERSSPRGTPRDLPARSNGASPRQTPGSNCAASTLPCRRFEVVVPTPRANAPERIGQRAREKRGEKFTNLLSHIKVPHQGAAAEGGVPTPPEGRGAWGRRGNVGRVRRGSRRTPARPPRPCSPRQLPPATGTTCVHSEGRRKSPVARDPRAGRQNRPASGADADGADLRTWGVFRVFVRLPAWPVAARRPRRARGGHRMQEGELGARGGHPRLLRHDRSRVDAEDARAPDRGSAPGAAADEVAARGRHGGGKAARGERRNAAGGHHQPYSGEHLPSLRARPVGPEVEKDACARRRIRRALRGRLCATTARRGGRDVAADSKQPCCARDEGWPLGTGLQDRVSNHRMLLWSNGRGGERDGKGGTNPSGERREGERE